MADTASDIRKKERQSQQRKRTIPSLNKTAAVVASRSAADTGDVINPSLKRFFEKKGLEKKVERGTGTDVDASRLRSLLSKTVVNPVVNADKNKPMIDDSEEIDKDKPVPFGYKPPILSGANRQATLDIKAFDKDLAVSGRRRPVAGYQVSGMTSGEFDRFSRTPARPATRAERGLTPVGPNNSGRGYSPDYGRNRDDQEPNWNELSKGFTGVQKQARIASLKKQYGEERRGARDTSRLGQSAQSAQASRTQTLADVEREGIKQRAESDKRRDAEASKAKPTTAKELRSIRMEFNKGFKDWKEDNEGGTIEEFSKEMPEHYEKLFPGKKKGMSASDIVTKYKNK